MTPVDYPQVIRESRSELQEILKERDRVEQRIAQLMIGLRALSRTLEPSQRDELLEFLKSVRRKPATLTESISEVLMRAGSGLTSSEIREELENGGFDLGDYSQPLGTIMTTLQRLVDSGRVRRGFIKGKSVVFIWLGDQGVKKKQASQDLNTKTRSFYNFGAPEKK